MIRMIKFIIYLILDSLAKISKMILWQKMSLPVSETAIFAAELKKTFELISVLETKDCLPSEREWRENINRLRSLVLSSNLEKFLKWDVVSKTMFVGNAPYILIELYNLRKRTDWYERWKKALKESESGHPNPFFAYPQSSGNTIHQAYHISQFEEKTGLRVDNLQFIFDFGGGYGNMCKVLYNLNFKGKYIIYDFLAFSALQKFYLRSVGIPVYTINSFDETDSGVLCISDFEELRMMLERYRNESRSLFIATWSISETSANMRNMILPLINNFKSYLIAYQDNFGEVNNKEFFEKWKKSINYSFEWKEWKINHLPGNNYLVGTSLKHTEI